MLDVGSSKTSMDLIISERFQSLLPFSFWLSVVEDIPIIFANVCSLWHLLRISPRKLANSIYLPPFDESMCSLNCDYYTPNLFVCQEVFEKNWNKINAMLLQGWFRGAICRRMINTGMLWSDWTSSTEEAGRRYYDSVEYAISGTRSAPLTSSHGAA